MLFLCFCFFVRNLFFFVRFGFIFLVGKSTAACQQNLANEIDRFGDILQPNVADDYSALPDKVLSAYQWIYYDVTDVATFYSFTDDDCVINMLNIYKHFDANFSDLLNGHKIYCGFHLAADDGPER